MKLIINAVSIFKGGGKVVLDELLLAISKEKIKNVVIFYDSRFDITNYELKNESLSGNYIIKFFKLLYYIKKIEKRDNAILINLNSIPLPFISSKQWVLFQNRMLLMKCIPKFEFSSVLKSIIFWTIFKFSSSKKIRMVYHLDETLAYLKDINKRCTFIKASLINNKIINNLSKLKTKNINKNIKKKFVTITSDTINKKNLLLLNAWEKVQHFLPNVTLTIVGINLTEENYKHLKIKFCQNLEWTETQKILNDSDFLIFNSVSECLGLPLIEAKSNNIKTVAPDLDFVWEVLQPHAVYNPNDLNSLVRAIIISAGGKLFHNLNFKSGKDFLKLIENKEKIKLH